MRDIGFIRGRWVRRFHKPQYTKSPTLDPTVVDELKVSPPRMTLGDVPPRYKVEEEVRVKVSHKAVGPGGLPVEVLTFLADEGDLDTLETSTISSSLCGRRSTCRNTERTKRSRCCTSRKIGRSVERIVVSPSLRTPEKYFAKLTARGLSDYCESEYIARGSVGLQMLALHRRYHARNATPAETAEEEGHTAVPVRFRPHLCL